jgi:hypothetical protein
MMRADQINSHEIATIWADADYYRIVNEFNMGTTDAIDVLITTFAVLCIPGPHFHGVCHHGIMLEIPDTLEEHFHTRTVLLPGDEPFTWEA